MEFFVFWILAILSVIASIMMVASKNPVRSALYLVLTFLTMAVFYITLSAQFIAAVQVIVYAGAIMVLFLFVIMLLNLGGADALRERGSIQPVAAIVLGAAFMIALWQSQALVQVPGKMASSKVISEMGTVQNVGLALYSPSQPWLFPFEAVSILLLIAVVGAIIMAKKKV